MNTTFKKIVKCCMDKVIAAVLLYFNRLFFYTSLVYFNNNTLQRSSILWVLIFGYTIDSVAYSFIMCFTINGGKYLPIALNNWQNCFFYCIFQLWKINTPTEFSVQSIQSYLNILHPRSTKIYHTVSIDVLRLSIFADCIYYTAV